MRGSWRTVNTRETATTPLFLLRSPSYCSSTSFRSATLWIRLPHRAEYPEPSRAPSPSPSKCGPQRRALPSGRIGCRAPADTLTVQTSIPATPLPAPQLPTEILSLILDPALILSSQARGIPLVARAWYTLGQALLWNTLSWKSELASPALGSRPSSINLACALSSTRFASRSGTRRTEETELWCEIWT